MLMLHRTLLSLAGDLRGPLLRSVAVGWALLALRVTQAAVVGLVIGAVLDLDQAPPLWIAGTVLAVVMTARAAAVWARDVVAQRSAEAIKVDLRDRLVAHLLTLGPVNTTGRRSGQVQATVVDGVEGLEAYYSRYLPQLVVAVTGPPVVIGWILLRAPLVGMVVLAAVVAVPLLPRLWDRVLARRGKDHWQAYEGLAADYLDAMQGMTTLKSLDAVDRHRGWLRGRSTTLARSTMAQMAVSLVDTGLTVLGTQVGVALAVGVGAVQVARGGLDLATLSILLVLAGECFRPLQELSAQWHAGFLGVSAADGIAALLDAEPEVADPADAPDLPRPEAPPQICLERVTLRHPGQPVPALRDVDLVIPAGATVGIVGRSGAGKTSLVAGLLRLRALESGRILLDGHDLAGVSARSVRRQVAVVSQDPYLFAGTIADNLRLAAPDATDEVLRDALRAADAAGFVADLGGLTATVGDRGATLSGGQRQRIGIARALLADAPVLVLDEPTSAVDARSEAAIMTALRERTGTRTTIVIAHRLSTVADADLLVVLEDGRVAQQGTHASLLARGGPYAELVALQSAAVHAATGQVEAP